MIVENNPGDAQCGAKLLDDLGFTDVVTRTRGEADENYVQSMVEGAHAPELIILDLLFNNDFWCRLLRDWKSNPRDRRPRILVWSNARERINEASLEQQICTWLGVELVYKFEGIDALLAKIKSSANHHGRC